MDNRNQIKSNQIKSNSKIKELMQCFAAPFNQVFKHIQSEQQL